MQIVWEMVIFLGKEHFNEWIFVCLQVPVSTEDLFATRPRTKKASLTLRFESAEIGIWHSNWRQILRNLASFSKRDLGRQDWMKKARTSKSSKGHGRSWRWKTMNTSKLWKTSLNIQQQPRSTWQDKASREGRRFDWFNLLGMDHFFHILSPLGWTWVPLDLSLSLMALLPNFQDPFYLPFDLQVPAVPSMDVIHPTVIQPRWWKVI